MTMTYGQYEIYVNMCLLAPIDTRYNKYVVFSPTKTSGYSNGYCLQPSPGKLDAED